MPAISFSVFKDKLLSGEKCQTIRKPRKKPLKVGDTLHVFWKMRTKECEKLGVTKIVKIEKKFLVELTDEEVHRDGFKNWKELGEWFSRKYGEFEASQIKFKVITFEPLKREAPRTKHADKR